MDISKDSIKDLISKGKLDMAFDQLEALAEGGDDDLQNTIILQSARFKRLHRDERAGVIGFEDASRTRNQITYGLLSLMDEIEDVPIVNRDEAKDSATVNVDEPDVIEATSTTILFLAANPRDSRALRIGEELAKIEASLQWSDNRDSFIVEQQWASGVKELRRAMLKYKPNIVHFSGHGSPEGGILLEDDEGYAKELDIESFGNLFSMFVESTQCVLLNSCYSEPQAKELIKHVPFVIGTKDNIPDKTSIAFSEAFYEALGSGETIEEAFNFA